MKKLATSEERDEEELREVDEQSNQLSGRQQNGGGNPNLFRTSCFGTERLGSGLAHNCRGGLLGEKGLDGGRALEEGGGWNDVHRSGCRSMKTKVPFAPSNLSTFNGGDNRVP